MIEQIIFYSFAGILLFASTMVVTARNPVFAALFLVVAFFASAAIWLLLEAEFLAIALVLVYVGAVMVLFLFVVMMLDINVSKAREGFANYLPIALAVGIVMVVAMGLVVGYENFGPGAFSSPEPKGIAYNNTATIGRALFTDYIFPFEVAAVILLVAIIAAILLTLRPPRERKTIRPEEQVSVTSAGRVALVPGAKDEPVFTDTDSVDHTQ